MKLITLLSIGISASAAASCSKDMRKNPFVNHPVAVVIDTPKTVFNPDSVPHLVAKTFTFTEGPAVDKAGNIFFTDQPNNKIYKYGTDGKISLFMDNAGRSNGMYFDKAGNLIACADENNQLWQISPNGKVKVLVDKYAGQLLNGPNDVWVHPNGNMYFTDPYYKRNYWTRTQPAIAPKVYYLKPRGQPIQLVDSLKQPNGIVGTKDGKTLFVADINDGKTYKYTINADGTLSNRILFCAQGSDGIVLDNFGNLYLTGKGVTVYNSKGVKVATIDIPEPSTSNVCFGGKNKDVLFITARTAVYTLKMNVKGVE